MSFEGALNPLKRRAVPSPPFRRMGNSASFVKANSFATFYYRPDRYQGKITLLRTVTSLGLDVQDSTLGWSQYSTQEVEVHLVPGRHLNFLRPPHVQKVAQTLKYCFERLEKQING